MHDNLVPFQIQSPSPATGGTPPARQQSLSQDIAWRWSRPKNRERRHSPGSVFIRGVFHTWGYPKMDGLIQGYPHLWKPPRVSKYSITSTGTKNINRVTTPRFTLAFVKLVSFDENTTYCDKREKTERPLKIWFWNVLDIFHHVW